MIVSPLRRSTLSFYLNPALTRWANFAPRLRRWAELPAKSDVSHSEIFLFDLKRPSRRGQVLTESCKAFWPVRESQHAKLNMASFVLCLQADLGLRFRMAGVCAKTPENELPTGTVEGKRAPWKQHSAVSDQRSARTKNLLPQRTRRRSVHLPIGTSGDLKTKIYGR